jgi:hypothetical protein
MVNFPEYRATDMVAAAGFSMPFVCTPEELLGGRHEA